MSLIKRQTKRQKNRLAVPLAMIVLIALQITCERARADSELVSLMNAKSAVEFAAIQQRAAESAQLDADCEAQLSLKVIPRSCFRAMRLSNRVDHEHLFVAACIESAKQTSSRRDLSADNSALPPKCRHAVSERLADLEYLDQSERPEQLVQLVRARPADGPDSGPLLER